MHKVQNLDKLPNKIIIDINNTKINEILIPVG